MINLHDIRYARLGTRDLDGAVKFATSIVGLQLVAREGNGPISAVTRQRFAATPVITPWFISRAIPRIRRSGSN
jgi:catechol 2,3-dioxygenase-like lactoylglutathione lyase family enzyme